ncbi:Holliday junction resolvase RuvX [Spongiibacter sp. KMU-166]|uniref:Putative pre-16S rRNA nuclease n=1 Tax=Spongiibacter thalassae TaxID=2721624 RepID=A0ABX1GH38_9GAMM|nr:Holliday junction resolvase RuvX [Spongiibacter thalassae]NKI18478.1 Holliday junction resolvase RuvX [Spongiibacter thalassae]
MTAKHLLAFDYGLRWIGCAVGQSLTGTASPLTALRAKDGIPRWEDIDALLREWKPDAVVVGLPLNMDGSLSDMSQRARKFGNRIHGRFGIAVYFADERLSSFEAKGALLEQGGNREFKDRGVDSLSAVLILESWFREQA